MKLCIDCKHYDRAGPMHGTVGVEYFCGRKITKTSDLVLGGERSIGTLLHCYKERAVLSEDFCGPEGKYWEAKDA